MAQLISAWPSDPRSSVQSLVTPVKLSSDSCKFGFKYLQNGAVGESLKCSKRETMLFLCHVADWYWCDRCSYRAHDLDHVWTVVQEQKVCVTIHIVFVFLSYISGCRGNPEKFRQRSQFFRVNFSPPVACVTHPAHAYMPCR